LSNKKQNKIETRKLLIKKKTILKGQEQVQALFYCRSSEIKCIYKTYKIII